MKRRLDKAIEESFRKSSLWLNKVEEDCRTGKVFLTIRDNLIDIYYRGGRLFRYDKMGFKTHLKYASVITSVADDKDYLTERQLSNFKLSSDFESNYLRIKENCSNYSGNEASGISDVYHKHSYLSSGNVVVLDIEVSFESLDEKNKQDRIDFILLNKSTRTLQFIEAKHFSNKEIWSVSTPKVINQLQRYEKQIKKRKTEILSEYAEYVRILNRLFGISLPEPIDLDPKVTLLIFGFDNDQKTGRLKTLIHESLEYRGVKKYFIGNIKKVNPVNIWNSKVL
ncbi:MAG: hypothetical protein K8I03_13075 [Ignavibacteria bacterium]|nr:hypothetical protein [Ignavibacteria bacterium]